ncbi:hypothetical protein KIL84_012979 [Mauremys mutica]|uniref:Uncharacterized protein n=1 Tax=Mauremys mutica TaxID=74926 RepID=A0A9D4B8D4_9SAUR|nr:hypothetical protein KIL84_012979 [Mauremys mutica]
MTYRIVEMLIVHNKDITASIGSGYIVELQGIINISGSLRWNSSFNAHLRRAFYYMILKKFFPPSFSSALIFYYLVELAAAFSSTGLSNQALKSGKLHKLQSFFLLRK